MPKKLEIAPLPMAVSHSKEELMLQFKELVDMVEEELAALTEPSTTVAPGYAAAGVAAALDIENRSQSALEKRENFKQLIYDHEVEEQRVRKAVQRAEDAARRVAARRKLMEQSIQTYMEQRGIIEIPTLMGYFKLGKQPDKLIIDDETKIPPEYLDQEAAIVTTVNKDRVLAALDSGKEVPGAHLERNRKNLLIR
jgi:Siphovirus Gp157